MLFFLLLSFFLVVSGLHLLRFELLIEHLFVVLLDPLLDFLRLHEVRVVEDIVTVQALYPMSHLALCLQLQSEEIFGGAVTLDFYVVVLH